MLGKTQAVVSAGAYGAAAVASGLVRGCLRWPFQLFSLCRCILARLTLQPIHDRFYSPSPSNPSKSSKKWRKRDMAVTAVFLVLSPLCLLIFPLYTALKSLSDHLQPPRALTHTERKALILHDQLYPEEIVNQMRIVEYPSIMSILFLGNAAAFTLEYDIYLSGRKLAADVARHEIVHCQQYTRHGGPVPFLALYFAEFVVNYFGNGFHYHWAYLDIEYEKEAYYLEHLSNLREYLRQKSLQSSSSSTRYLMTFVCFVFFEI